MRFVVGFAIFTAGLAGVAAASRGRGGWARWDRRQRSLCVVSFALALVGIAVIG
ncbi:hypothetical protein OG500_35825 [Kitasatospora sp. NBC_01250]|uniref:hypothetical protein n=1 Tax=unclassified Kitasatospora TaxID=2633591 RepID=UPI002E116E6E|nr:MULTISPECIES: hypothetical protein [unclassified Kitasatospora]WSJ71313.1 hypothetical protein OG294_37335 [Kitasatospora sp. NBC_01302]